MTISLFRRVLILFAFAPVWAACYVPAPAELTAIGRGEDLRVLLSPVGEEALGRTSVGVTELRGELLGLTDDSLMIATRLSVPSYAGNTMETIRQPLSVPRADILQVTVPRLHRGRTAVVLGSALVVAVVMIADLFNIRGEGGSGPPDPPPDTSPFRGRW